MAIKEHDFIEINYTGSLEDGTIFDTTKEEVAKENNIHNPKATYEPLIVCVGENHVVPGLDKALVGKEVGKEFVVNLEAQDAFGKKDAKNIRLVPQRAFRKQNIVPQPGLQVNIDDSIATILRVSGGRILVDFNHPLSGKKITYKVSITKVIDDVKKQIESYLKLTFPLPLTVSVNEENKATITLEHNLPEELTKNIAEKLEKVTRAKKVTFEAKDKKESEKKESREDASKQSKIEDKKPTTQE